MRPVLPPLAVRPVPAPANAFQMLQIDARPPSPILDRTRLLSSEIIVAGGCMFPISDMLDMTALRSRPATDTEIVAINALNDLTALRRLAV